MDRQKLLHPTSRKDQLDRNTTFLVTTYNPSNPPFKKILDKNHPILESSQYWKNLADLKIRHGSRRNKNLSNYLVRAKLPKLDQPKQDHSKRTPKCKRDNCKYCSLFNRVEQVQSHTTGRKYTCRQKVDCESNNLVYLLSCTICGMQYVGETLRPFRDRCREHFRDIEYSLNPSKAPPSWLKNEGTPVGMHWSKPGHSQTNMKINVLSLIGKDPKESSTTLYRKHVECQWIHKLRSMAPFGVNVHIHDPLASVGNF